MMVAEHISRTMVRDATEADVPTLVAIKGEGTEALHYDRLHDAQRTNFRYVVLIADTECTGFACLVFRRPASWSDANDTHHLPQLVDLQVKGSHRGQGYGSTFLHALEPIVAEAGYQYVYVSVEPVTNPRAYSLYQRLGYHQLQSEPYQKNWSFTDSAGTLHQGEDWVVDMVKQVSF